MGTLIGGNGSGVLEGSSLRDRIYAGGGDDKINGFGGNDRLAGEGGRDTLIGGTGNDVLSGDGFRKSYADKFVFGKNSGKDIITDFDVGKDMLQIFKGLNGIKNASDVIDHATQKGKNVVIDLGGGNKITLKNVDLDDLKKNPGDHFQITKNLAN
ncbi:M10 family metallopeptidase C-terminal domain-containing protein [Rhizobium sp.]